MEIVPTLFHGFIFQTRCRFDVDLTDETNVMTASVFGELAEQLLGVTAVEAMDFFNKVYTKLHKASVYCEPFVTTS